MKQFIEFLIDNVADHIAGGAVAYAAGKGMIPPVLAASGDVQNFATKVGMLYAGQVPTYVSPDEKKWIESGKVVADTALLYVKTVLKVDVVVSSTHLGKLLQAVAVAMAARFPTVP